LHYRVLSREAMTALAEDAGWHVTDWHRPPTDDAIFRSLYIDPALYAALFAGLTPCAWRAERASL
jgi:hypothetical protein